MEFPEHVDYLVVGHISRDVTPDGFTIGGTAAYSAAAAKMLGCRTAVVTSYSEIKGLDKSLPEITIHNVPAAQTTTFENKYTAKGRLQVIHAVAGTIGEDDVPQPWRRASIAHIGPIADEVDPQVVNLFSNSLIGLTPQGWMRHWREDGVVGARPWPVAQQFLPLSAATFISEEDLLTPSMLDEFRHYSRVLVMTRGELGSIVFFDGDSRSFPAPAVDAVDLTGAGDIYATAFLVRLHQTGGDPWEAARFANEIAARSVTASGLPHKMQAIQEYLEQGD